MAQGPGFHTESVPVPQALPELGLGESRPVSHPTSWCVPMLLAAGPELSGCRAAELPATAQVAVTLSSLCLGQSQLLPSWASLGDERDGRQGGVLGGTVLCFVTLGRSETLCLRVGCSPRALWQSPL